jgi:hypothetical protein
LIHTWEFVVECGNKSLTYKFPCSDPVFITDSEYSMKPEPVTMSKGLMSLQRNETLRILLSVVQAYIKKIDANVSPCYFGQH